MPGVIALVVPVFRHSVLLFDAIHSLATADDAEILIIDDGCPNIETQFAGLGLAAMFPHVTYLRGRNRGLSGARNRGIDYVMNSLPAIEALYFLDADNMLSEWSLRQMRTVLTACPEDDWFYPDIRMFGLEWESAYAGAFTPLVESLINICEAGSLVRRRVFEEGLRFSEQLKLGFEDWDFWLTAIEHGFRGRHFPESGFRYRKRPESMLANSTRDQSQIRNQLEGRHPWMIDLKWAVTAEHTGIPRYAIYLTDLNIVRFTSAGDSATEELAWDQYVARFWASINAPSTFHAGAMLLVTTSLNLRALESMGLLSWTLFDLEVRLRDSNIAAVTVNRNSDNRLTIGPPETGPEFRAVLAVISSELLRSVAQDEYDSWILSAATPNSMPRISSRAIFLSHKTPYVEPIGDMIRQLVRACSEIRLSAYAGDTGLPKHDASLGTPDRAHVNNMLRAKFGGGVLPPELLRRGPELAFVLPRFEFGGVERVTMFAAAALRRRGYIVSLVLMKAQTIQLSDEFETAFDRIFFLDNQEFESWTGQTYLGTALTRWSLSGEQSNELNLLSIFDAVIACHAGDVMGLMGNLKRRGVVTGAYNHLFDVTPAGRKYGHPHIALAFEHALDLLIGCSNEIGLIMHAQGVPASKLVTVPNAAGVTIPPYAARASLDLHLARDAAKLNILFLGRIDPQKGLERLSAICARLRETGAANMRIIGRPIMFEAPELADIADLIEEPAYGDDLLNAYKWADVLLLPSLYEGLPLTIIEAMRMGVVPLAARTGAVHEIIEDGVNGLIVSQENCVSETLAHIAALTLDRPRLHALMTAAAQVDRNWDDAVGELDDALRRLLTKQARIRRDTPAEAA